MKEFIILCVLTAVFFVGCVVTILSDLRPVEHSKYKYPAMSEEELGQEESVFSEDMLIK